MGANNPAAFFARKILTPELVGGVLEALAPVVRERAGAGRPAAPADAESPFSGQLRGWPASDVCSIFASSGRTGELRFGREGATVIVYLRAGEIILVTSLEPRDHTGCEGGEVRAVAPAALAAAEGEQRASGKPVHVTLAEFGALPEGCDLRKLLHRVGRRLLIDCVEAREQWFAWRERPVLPTYAEAYARRVKTSVDTQPFDSSMAPEFPRAQTRSVLEMTLARLRESSYRDEAGWPEAAAVLDRLPGFSDKVKSLGLDARECRLLALVDGRYSLREIAVRATLEADEARRMSSYFVNLGLLAVAQDARRRPVLLLESEPNGLRRSLEVLLGQRAQPVPLLTLAAGDDLLETVRRERPRAVIFNAGNGGGDAGEKARALRSCEELDDVSLVALLELASAGRASDLTSAGFDAVLVKPVDYADLEVWINA